MKSKIFACALIGLAILAIFTAYSSGLRRGYAAGSVSVAEDFRVNNFITSFDTLKKLRASNYVAAIERLESFCYSSFVDASKAGAKSSLLDLYKKELNVYRITYTNSEAEQYPTQQRLDALLRDSKLTDR